MEMAKIVSMLVILDISWHGVTDMPNSDGSTYNEAHSQGFSDSAGIAWIDGTSFEGWSLKVRFMVLKQFCMSTPRWLLLHPDGHMSVTCLKHTALTCRIAVPLCTGLDELDRQFIDCYVWEAILLSHLPFKTTLVDLVFPCCFTVW